MCHHSISRLIHCYMKFGMNDQLEITNETHISCIESVVCPQNNPNNQTATYKKPMPPPLNPQTSGKSKNAQTSEQAKNRIFFALPHRIGPHPLSAGKGWKEEIGQVAAVQGEEVGVADEARPPARRVQLHVRPHVPLLAGQPREHHHHAGGRARPPPAAPVVPPPPHPAPAPASRPLPEGPGSFGAALNSGGEEDGRARVLVRRRGRVLGYLSGDVWRGERALGGGTVLVEIMLWSI